MVLRTVSQILLFLLTSCAGTCAIGQSTCVYFDQGSSNSSSFSVVSDGQAAPVFLSSDDWGGVQFASLSFVSDIQKVTGATPSIANATTSSFSNGTDSFATISPIIIGTLGQSSLISAIVNHTNMDVSSIDGQWEAFMTMVVDNPLPGLSQAYVMIGSDKRGTIYALYDHSEQFGVSPWYWWADVPVTRHSELFVVPSGCSHSSPTVKYRGLFLNDEQPALQNWAADKFTNGTGAPLTGSPFNHFFYTNLFDLLLRLKANYLWPAQWSSAFCVDDPQNQFLADYYGIVMGTSHEEPMQRSIPVEWSLFGNGTAWDYETNSQNIYNFWVEGVKRAKPFETLYTIGMRGDGDLPLGTSTNVQLLEKIVSDQRGIFQDVYGNDTDVATIPQMWCLYQEVQGYYEDGMTVPDDVTLLWTDDTWGNVRRYPVPSERNRTGGAGVYYHYDLVGPPRDYKWIQSTQVSKVYEQLSLAVDREATRIWILNVGDLKPYEMSIEFFMSLAWNSSVWNLNNLNTFVSSWATREFSLSPEDADEVAQISANMTMALARIKPELINSTTFSLINYREAETILDAWTAMNESASRIYNSLPSEAQPSFFQLLYHPVQAGFTLTNMWISAGINNMRAMQARLSANEYADIVENLFEVDYDLEEWYHGLLDGKWDQMMAQTHTDYSYWQEPTQNMMPSVLRVSSRKPNIAGAMRITPEGTLGTWPGDSPYQCAQGYSCPEPSITITRFTPFGNKFVDISMGGSIPFTFTVTSNASWLSISNSPSATTFANSSSDSVGSAFSGNISTDNMEQRVFLNVDWSSVEEGSAENVTIWFNATTPEGTPGFLSPTSQVMLTVTANNTVPAENFTGFVEGDGAISIEAAHATSNTTVGEVSWTEIPNYGRTLSGVTPWPRLGNNETNYTAGTGPSLKYSFYTFNSIDQSGNISVVLNLSPSLNANGDDRPLAIATQIDSQTPRTYHPIPAAAPGGEPPDWQGWVANALVQVGGDQFWQGVWPGAHTLTVWMIEPAVVLQKILIDTGGLQPSYLGPPESILV